MSTSLFVDTDSPYLLSHSVGLMPKSTQEYFQKHYFLPWSRSEGTLWPTWLDSIEHFRQQVSRLFNTDKKQICPQANISSAVSKILGSVAVTDVKKNVLLLSEEDFPSLGFVFEQAARFGFTTRFISKHQDHTDLSLWSEHLHDDVFAVFLTHVQSNTGIKIPVNEIAKIAREREILSIADVAQSSGVIPIDLSQSAVDFVVGSCVKWLCGGPGAGFLWADNNILKKTRPTDVGWFSHQNPFEFDIHNFEYAEDALRFWGGTPSVAPFVIAGNSINTLLNIGIKKITEHNLKCKRYICERIAPEIVLSPVDEEKQGGTLILKNTPQYEHHLSLAKIKFDSRPTGIRLSPHIYTAISSLESVAECFTDAK